MANKLKNKSSMIITSILCCMILSLSTIQAETNNGGLIVEVNGFQSVKGKVMIALYNSEPDYDDDEKPFREAALEIVEGKTTWNLADLPNGEYAIKLYHDENNNHIMDTNFFGVPKESVGFSNNAKPNRGAPAYSEARFKIQGGVVKQTIRLIYM